MGQVYGKTCGQWEQNYFQEQLSLYRWRAHPSENSHLPRVTFTSKSRLLSKQKLQNFMHRQLVKNSYVDVKQYTDIKNKSVGELDEEIMTFESFFTTLTLLESTLSLEENLFILMALLSGYQTIFKKFGKVYVDTQCCFVTEKGELRTWINSNPVLNQFIENVTHQITEGSSINSILKVCQLLTEDQCGFTHVQNQLAKFLQRDLLHNLTFSSVRKFINGYTYAHRLIIPKDIRNVVQKVKGRIRTSSLHSSGTTSTHNRNLSSNSQGFIYANNAFISTKANMNYQSSNVSQQNGTSLKTSSISCSSGSNNREIQFYKPDQPFLKNFSMLDLNLCKGQGPSTAHSFGKINKRSLNRSELVQKKSVNMTVSNSFSKKNRPDMIEASNIMTHNCAKENYPCKMYPGTKESLTATGGHSKHPSDVQNSKVMHSNPSMNIFEIRNQPYQRITFLHHESDSKNKPRTEQSRQPSFDQNSSSLFISPANELNQPANEALKVSQVRRRRKPNLTKIEDVSEFDQSEEGSSFMGANISTRGQIYPSVYLNRQVSHLVENKDVQMYQSRGSFLSFEGSSASASQYKGALLGLCQSQKMFSVGTSKRLQRN